MDEYKLKLPFELNTVASYMKQSAIVRPEGAAWHQFIWVKDGVGTFRMRGESFILEKGQGIFMRAGVPCSYDGENLYTAWCAFFTTEHLVDYVLGKREYLLFDVPDYLAGATEELQALARGNTTTLELSAATYSYVTELFSTVISNKERGAAFKIKEFLYNNYARALTLDDIAKEVGLDKFAVCRVFKERYGASVMKELNSIRITKAKRMLRYTAESVEGVGKLCGFESHSYFTKRFGEICGCTPREYRSKYM